MLVDDALPLHSATGVLALVVTPWLVLDPRWRSISPNDLRLTHEAVHPTNVEGGPLRYPGTVVSRYAGSPSGVLSPSRRTICTAKTRAAIQIATITA
jgi:hypothetical protein